MSVPPGAVRLTASQVRVLNAIDEVYRRDGRVTIRAVCRASGLVSTSSVHYHLHRLEALGLVTWERDRQCSLRPLVDRADIDRNPEPVEPLSDDDWAAWLDEMAYYSSGTQAHSG